MLFAREGADIAVIYLTEHADAKVTKAAVEAEGRRCILISGDVSQTRPLPRRGGTHREGTRPARHPRQQCRLPGALADFEELTAEQFDATLKTNLYGYFHMAQAAVAHMRPGAVILNTGSVTGIDGSKELLDYSMTKGGIHAFTRALAGNLLPRGIRVNAVAPGPVWTPLNPSDKEAADVSQFGARTPMKRPAQPEEIAPAYVFLASPHCSSYITGEILPIIGGY